MKGAKAEMNRFDLHVHSTASDGNLTPSELIAKAIDCRLSGLALTDHDSLNGLTTFMSAPAPSAFQRIPGIELTVEYNGIRCHLLGYYVSDNGGIITEHLGFQRMLREQRLMQIISNLRNHGIEIPDEFLERGRKPSISEIADFLVTEGYSESKDQAEAEYLAKNGIAYVEKKRLRMLDMIRVLRSDRAVPVLAHPFTINVPDIRQCLEDLNESGLLGVEAYYDYTHHNVVGDIEEIVNIGNELGLILTGGSDYHADETSPALGSISVGIDVIEELGRARKNL